MKSTALAINWKTAKEGFTPSIDVLDTDLKLNFKISSEGISYLQEDEPVFLNFQNVYGYSSTNITAEAYNQGAYRWKEDDLQWGGFIELKKSNFLQNPPTHFQQVIKNPKGLKLRHFVFFGPEQIIECIAEDYKFSFENDPQEALEAKYPKAYLNYYLSLFFTHFENVNAENLRMFTDLYLQLTKRKDFPLLQDEVKAIEKNKDAGLVLKYVHSLTQSKFTEKQLKEVLKYIVQYK
ncbi:hypothetical protein SAMN05216474_1112 [Lishizhenia tianjinensis]|uniref:Uncharacterized protein n=1 Tax=Lishizhenia tianjinensis TaxID=477690 RepID=A0A1I6YRM2_9FLAO|nr:hypothetical protein [Lishizhenia tianjinensis]SFT53018.1 hypothetical protein SAMN05216474_1112 [Lishizhenia tianjinensis]